jgi:TrpR-related protein YerC/YecD
MKRPDRSISAENRAAERELCKALATMESMDEVRNLLRDLCTPAELEALADRWRVVAPLKEGRPYREIHETTGVSVTTIGRVARFLDRGFGGYKLAFERLTRESGTSQAKQP